MLIPTLDDHKLEKDKELVNDWLLDNARQSNVSDNTSMSTQCIQFTYNCLGQASVSFYAEIETRLQPTRPLGFLPSRLLLVLPLLPSIYFQYDLVGYYFIFQAQKRDLYSSTPTLSLVGPRRLTIWSGSLPSTDYIPSPYDVVTVLAILPFDFPVFRDLC